MRTPPKMICRACSKDMGRGWAEAPLCDTCSSNLWRPGCHCIPEHLVGIRRVDYEWVSTCPIHLHNPFDIPF